MQTMNTAGADVVHEDGSRLNAGRQTREVPEGRGTGADTGALAGDGVAGPGTGSSPGTPDAEWLRRARQGDVDAFAAVFESYRTLAYRVAYRLVGPDDAQDVVMDTYLKAWQALPDFEGRASLKTWLCRIARNCALDRLRRRQREDRRQISAYDPEMAPLVERVPDRPGQGPDDRAVASETGALIEKALAQLSPEHRAVLLLREVDGLSYGEIAAAVGIHIGTVMSRLFYARHRMQRLLREYGI